MITVLRNTGLLLDHEFDIDGIPTDASGSVTVVITRADGTELTSGTATHVSDGVYSFVLAPQATLDLLTVTWSGTWSGIAQSQADQVEVVGGVYLTIAEMRALPGLADSNVFPNQRLTDTRREFEDLAERYTGTAWVPRFAVDRLRGCGASDVLLSRYPVRTVLSASSTDTAGVTTAFTTTYWQGDDIGRLITNGTSLTASSYGEPNLTVAYEHGHDSPPEPLKRACRIWVARELIADRSQVARDVLSLTDPSGFSTRYSTPDWSAGRPTGILEVDSILNGLGRAAPAIA